MNCEYFLDVNNKVDICNPLSNFQHYETLQTFRSIARNNRASTTNGSLQYSKRIIPTNGYKRAWWHIHLSISYSTLIFFSTIPIQRTL